MSFIQFYRCQLIHLAVLNRNLKMVECLHKYGSNLNAVDQKGFPVSIFAAQSLEILKYLVKHGVDLSIKDVTGGTVAHNCGESVEIVKYLESLVLYFL